MKIPKAELKKQRDIYNKILTGTTLTEEFIDHVYEEFNPAIIDNLTEGGVYFTPYRLAQDLAVFSPRRGHIVDMCAGIGMLSYRLKDMDSYDKKIKSITCIEYNPKFVEIGKKLVTSDRIKINWICANAYDKSLWDDLVKDLPDQRFDEFVSNPPFGVDQVKTIDSSWLNYKGSRDLMALEICLRYSKNGSFIVPTSSAPFSYSGRPYYEDKVDRWSQKFKKFVKENSDKHFTLTCDGIDTSIYNNEWKNLPGGIGCEVVDVSIYPWSMNLSEDSITNKI